jgi:serine protease Do
MNRPRTVDVRARLLLLEPGSSLLLAMILLATAMATMTTMTASADDTPSPDGDRLVLEGGAEVFGEIVKRTGASIWIDVGPQVLEFRLADVAEVVDVDGGTTKAGGFSGGIFSTAEDLPERSPLEQAERLGPTVVKVATPGGLGSGVIVHPDGYAVTNAHVVQGETALRATVWLPEADGSTVRTTIEDVELVAINNHYDLALVRIPHPEGVPFDFAPLERADELEPGQPIFAIGNPLGLEQTLTEGVVSTRTRQMDGLTYIQIDVAINPGNSGGPLFNARGEVVGITNMGILSMESLNFAIPARYVKDFLLNRSAFAYDESNPNSGHRYHLPPTRRRDGVPSQLLTGPAQRAQDRPASTSPASPDSPDPRGSSR